MNPQAPRGPPTHLLYKALGNPMRMALILILYRRGHATKTEAHQIISRALPHVTLDQLDRQLRMLEEYGVVSKKAMPHPRRPGRSPKLYALTPEAREFYKSLLECTWKKPPSSTRSRIPPALSKLEISFYFTKLEDIDVIKEVLRQALALANVTRTSLKSRLERLAPADCGAALSVLGDPLPFLLWRVVPSERRNRIAKAALLDPSVEWSDLVEGSRGFGGECDDFLLEALTALMAYLVTVEGWEDFQVELLMAEMIWRPGKP